MFYISLLDTTLSSKLLQEFADSLLNDEDTVNLGDYFLKYYATRPEK